MAYIEIGAGTGANAGSCNTCCCEPLALRPGETELVTLSYVAWSVPISGRGLIPTPEITVTLDDSACTRAPIDGFEAPNTGNVLFNNPQDIPANAPTVFNLTSDTFPAGNSFEYRLVPVSGPLHGTLTTPITGTAWTYTPQAGFNGYDQFWARITDAQGRSIVRPINLRVGAVAGNPPFGWGLAAAFTGLLIDRQHLQIDARLHRISFPIMLQPSGACDTIDGCRRYRITIKAFASDCERTLSRIDCFDVRCRNC
jgi:hypothetical protein